MGLQISVEKIAATLATYQSTSVKTLVKEERSFGFWSPRRCDVYVVSYHAGNLQDRMEVVAYLWQHKISADLMYESALTGPDLHENHLDLCAREGILCVARLARVSWMLMLLSLIGLRCTRGRGLPAETNRRSRSRAF